MATRSATPSPPPKLWVASTAAPPAALKPSRNSLTHLRPRRSSPVKGSSSRSSRAWPRRTRASPSRRFMPAENVRTRSSATPSSSTWASAASSRAAAASPPPHRLPEAQVLPRGEVLVDVRAVRHHADERARPLGLAEGVGAADAERAGGGAEQGGQDPEQRGLAGAVGAEQGQALAGAQLEGHAVDHAVRPVGLPELPRRDHVREKGETVSRLPRPATRTALDPTIALPGLGSGHGAQPRHPLRDRRMRREEAWSSPRR